MEYSDIRVLEALFTLLRKGVENVRDYNQTFPEFPLQDNVINHYM